MSRLTLHTRETAPEASRPLVDKALAANGYLPNLIGVLAGAPVALETYQTVSAINARASLTLVEREVVQIVAARNNGCDFCVAGHSAIALKKAGFAKEKVLALHYGGPTGDARIDALQNFVSAVIASRGNVSAGQLSAFTEAGFNEQQVLEVLLGISLATLCNCRNSCPGI